MSAAFRFGLVSMPRDGQSWASQARRVESLGYDSLLVPDNLDASAALVACTAAAAVTERLRVGPYVMSVPMHVPGLVAVEAATLHLLSQGRLELGLGTGRPGSDGEAERLGLRFGTPGERMARLEATIAAVRERAPDVPLTVAASGPRMLALAGRTADVVALGASPLATEDQLAAMTAQVREAVGERAADVVLNQNLSAVGDDVPPWLEQRMGLTVRQLVEAGSAGHLRGTPQEMADTLLRRRDTTGVSYLCAAVDNAERLAPVVELLHGR